MDEIVLLEMVSKPQLPKGWGYRKSVIDIQCFTIKFDLPFFNKIFSHVYIICKMFLDISAAKCI